MLRRIGLFLLVGFIIFYLLTAPVGAADAVSSVWDFIIGGFSQLGIFFNELVE